MKKLLTASLPALALLALGGCAASRSVATTEDDGVYYSRQDRTTAIAQAPQPRSAAPQGQPAPAATGDEAVNPDYQAGAGTQRSAPNAPDYYDDNYNTSPGSYDNSARFRRPYAGPTVGLAYYAPPVVFAPVYNDYGYGYGFNDFGYSPFGGPFGDPFFSPYAFAQPFYNPYAFYGPFGYGFGRPFISLNFGFGRPWGGYGYGRGFYGGGFAYDPFFDSGFYGGGFYGGGFGGGGFYGQGYCGRGYRGHSGGLGNGGYYGNQPIVRADGSSRGGNSPVLVGRRGGRGGDVLADRNPAVGGNVPPAGAPGGRRNMDGAAPTPGAPIGGIIAPSAPAAGVPVGAGNSGRRRLDGGPASAPNRPTPIATNQDQPGTGTRLSEEASPRNGGDQPGRYAPPAGSPEQPARASRGRWRNLDEGGAGTATGNPASAPDRRYEQPTQPDAQPQPTERPVRRGRFAETAPDNDQAQQPVAQPERQAEQPQRTYERPQRTYEQPQRSQEQPQRSQERQEQPQRSYEQPQRAERSSNSSPSYSPPASSGSNSNGGGGGGRRGGRW